MCPPTRTAPLVATVHDLFPLLEPGTLTRRGVRMMTTAFDLMRRRASIVTCSSQQTLDDCIAHGFDPDRLRLVPLGATAVEVSADQRREVRRRHRLDQRYLLWVGTIEPRKNLPLLIEAHRRAAVDDLELVIVGPAGWNTELSAMLGRDHPGIRALGFVPDHDLAVLMAGAEALMFPSRREGFGLPAVEAMAQGTPVVGSAGTAIAEVVGDSGRLLDHRDLDGWIDTITEIAGDAEWKPPRQAAARRRAANFTWELTAEATMAAYRDAITDPRPRKSAWK